jgi:hypothetical protein
MHRVPELTADPALTERVRQVLGLADGAVVPFRVAREAASALAVGDRLHRAYRPGWTVVATDVHGLPWYDSGKHHSHGTWGRHEKCGAIAKMTDGPGDCPACGPESGSRTHQARRDETYLLYLVQTHKYQKFGVGDRRRVRTHIRGGAEVIQVLSGPFAHVILAEKALKALHRDVTVRRIRRGMIESFGQGTEVVPRWTPVSLTQVMPDGEDVTHWFHVLRTEQVKDDVGPDRSDRQGPQESICNGYMARGSYRFRAFAEFSRGDNARAADLTRRWWSSIGQSASGSMEGGRLDPSPVPILYAFEVLSARRSVIVLVPELPVLPQFFLGEFRIAGD